MLDNDMMSGVYMTPSSSGSGKDGILLRRRAAFPLIRRTAMVSGLAK